MITYINASISGIYLEYETVGAYLCFLISATSLIQPIISFGFLSAFSMACTLTLPYFFLVMNSFNIRSALALLVWLRVGSSNTYNPNNSSLLSGLDIFRNASTSPTAVIYSGMNGFSLASISICSGWNLVIYLNSSFTS